MRLRRGVDRPPTFIRARACRRNRLPRPMPRRAQRNQRRFARRAFDDAPAPPRSAAALAQEVAGQPDRPPQPIQHPRLELCARRARRPQHPLHAQPRAQQFPHHRWRRNVARKKSVEVGMLPVREPRHHNFIKIPHDLAPPRLPKPALARKPALRRFQRQRPQHIPGPGPRQHRQRLRPRPQPLPIPPNPCRRPARRVAKFS